jgi:hypothetical protein
MRRVEPLPRVEFIHVPTPQISSFRNCKAISGTHASQVRKAKLVGSKANLCNELMHMPPEAWVPGSAVPPRNDETSGV